MIKAWIEAMRLRTLPVSVAGVIMAIGYAVHAGCFDAAPAMLCLAFAVLAQIASNFANEYFDYTGGRDRVGREGPRRGVTEGDITPGAMLRAIYLTLGAACCIGLSLVAWSGWWLIAVGAAIAVGVFAYSTGPYPLSTHGLGEVAVVFFFGLIPVCFTYYLQGHQWPMEVILGGLAIGLMGANVLIINNYRDLEDDRAVSKLTLAVRLGRPTMRVLYMVNAVCGAALTAGAWAAASAWWLIAPAIYCLAAAAIVRQMGLRTGASLTPLLGATALSMLAFAAAFLASAVI